MYQVVELFGEYEPWWFFENWQENILSEKEFSIIDEAIDAYQSLYQKYEATYETHQTKDNWLTAFWNTDEIRYCEECEDDVQLFHSILLLKDGKPVENAKDSHKKE